MGDSGGAAGGGGGGGGTQPLANAEFEQEAAGRAIRQGDTNGSTIRLRQEAAAREAETRRGIAAATEGGNTQAVRALNRQLRDERAMDNRAVYMFRQGMPIRDRFFDAGPTIRLTSAQRTASARELATRYNRNQLTAARSLLRNDARRVAGNTRNVAEANARLNVINRAIRMNRGQM